MKRTLYVLFSILSTAAWCAEPTINVEIKSASAGQASHSRINSSKNRTQLASLGRETGNGGDTYGIEFVEIGREISQALTRYEGNSGAILPKTGFKLSTFNLLLGKLEVISIDADLYLGGVRKDAISYSAHDKTILSLPRWKQMDPAARERLVLHEMCVNMGLEISNRYELSLELLKIANQHLETGVVAVAVSTMADDTDGKPCTETIRQATLGVYASSSSLKEGESFYVSAVPISQIRSVMRGSMALDEITYSVQAGTLFNDGSPYDGYDVFTVKAEGKNGYCQVRSLELVDES